MSILEKITERLLKGYQFNNDVYKRVQEIQKFTWETRAKHKEAQIEQLIEAAQTENDESKVETLNTMVKVAQKEKEEVEFEASVRRNHLQTLVDVQSRGH